VRPLLSVNVRPVSPVSIATENSIVDSVLRRFMSRYGVQQLFLFGSSGEPFRAARLTVQRDEVGQLEFALDLIERMEVSRPRPFFARDSEHDLLVAALEDTEDLYVVVLGVSGEPEPVESRVALLRAELIPYVGSLRV